MFFFETGFCITIDSTWERKWALNKRDEAERERKKTRFPSFKQKNIIFSSFHDLLKTFVCGLQKREREKSFDKKISRRRKKKKRKTR